MSDEQTFGAKMREKNIGVLPGGRTEKRNVKEFRDPSDGHIVKKTRDEATSRGNVITEHGGKGDRTDVLMRPDALQYGFRKVTE